MGVLPLQFQPGEGREALGLEGTERFGVDSDDITIDPADGGDPSEVVTISLTYEHESRLPSLYSLFPDQLSTYTIQSSMRNEPFFDE